MGKREIVSEIRYGRYTVQMTGDMRVIAADDGFYELTGYTEADMQLGKICFSKLFYPSDFPIYMEKLMQILQKKDDTYLEHRLQKKNGELIFVFCYGKIHQETANEAYADIVIADVSEIKSMEDRYSETELELETLLKNIPGGVVIFEVGDDFCVRYATDEYYRMLGYTKETYFAAKRHFLSEYVYEADRAQLDVQMNNTVRHGTPVNLQIRMENSNGELVWIELHAQFLRLDKGKPLVYAAVFNITDSKKRDESLRLQSERYQMIAEYTDELIYDYDVLTDTIHLPKQVMGVMNAQPARENFWKKINTCDIIYSDDKERFVREMESVLFSPTKTSIDVRAKAFTEDYVWFRVLAMSSADEQGKIIRVFGRMYSIDKIKRMKKTIHEDKAIIERLSTTDPVTGLLNRASFKEKVEDFMRAADPERCYAMVYSDINDFSYINDNFGYDAGNTMLFEFGVLLSNSENSLFSCRINSDYFLALMTADSEEELERAVTTRDTGFWRRQRKKYPASELLVSTGICFVHPGECDVTVEMDNANLARRKAKETKSKPCCIYYDQLRITRTREKIIAAELHGAIESRTVELFLQPKFLMDSRKIIGAEALVRWRNPDGSYRMPFEFIDILEKVGYIIELDFFMYEEVLKTLKRWKDLGIELVPISVNFSRLHSNYSNWVDRVVFLAEQYGVDSRYVEIEVTESAFASDIDSMAQNMSRLREAGFSIDIDDFGKGYSSLSFLIGSPIDIVKVDKAFVDGIELSDKHREYIKQMCMLIKATEKEIVFEGVETQSQADFLCSCGFKKAQGWLLDKAVPVPVFEERYMTPVIVTTAEEKNN